MTTITEPNQIESLLGLVHDWWFDVSQIVYDRNARTVTFRLEPRQNELVSPSGRGVTLKINKVRELEINDTERVRYYDLNEIGYDTTSQTIKLTGGVPIEIHILTEGLSIEASTNM